MRWLVVMVCTLACACTVLGMSPNVTQPMANGKVGPADVNHTYVDVEVGGVRYLGHLLTLSNPRGHYAVLPPYPDGCGHKQYTSVTASAGGCVAATNAGFFDVATGACLGNLVSDGAVVQTAAAGVIHSNFGILGDTNFFVGYLPEDMTTQDLAKLGFTQLVSGVGWLVRDGLSFVNESVAIEGISGAFVEEAAPRLAIGFNAQGALMILEINGAELAHQGPGLEQMAALAIHMGFTNAINLDGGGSDTVWLEGVLCASCGAHNDTCTAIDAPSAASSGPGSSSRTRHHASEGPGYPPCLCCGYAFAEDGRGVGEASSCPEQAGPAIPLCQRQVTSINCIH